MEMLPAGRRQVGEERHANHLDRRGLELEARTWAEDPPGKTLSGCPGTQC